KFVAILGALHKAGVPIVAGTDQFDFAVQAVARNTLIRSGNDGYSSLVQRPQDGHEFCKPSFLEIRNRRGRSDVRQDCSKFRWDLGNTWLKSDGRLRCGSRHKFKER